MKKNILLAISVLILVNCYCQKYEPTLINYKSTGFLMEIGIPYYEVDDCDLYTPLILGGIFDLPLYKTKNFFNVSLSFYPNIVVVANINDQNAYEFGFNVRANLNFAISKYDVIRGSIGSGPQYMDYHCCRQAYGFLFSDYFLVSYIRYFKLHKSYCNFEFEFGYRHISNAGITEPNRGISTFLVGFGFKFLLNKKHPLN